MCVIPTLQGTRNAHLVFSSFALLLGDVRSLLEERCQTRMLEPFEILELVNQINNQHTCVRVRTGPRLALQAFSFDTRALENEHFKFVSAIICNKRALQKAVLMISSLR